jgi:SecD/SecF fusion protein
VPLEYWERIDKFGVTQPNIQKLGESGQILVEPGAKDVDRIKKLLQSTAQLSFGKRTRLKKWVIS